MSGGVDPGRRRFLRTAGATIAATRLGALGSVLEQAACAAARAPVEGDLPSFAAANEWLNSRPLSASSLRGKVVLVQFWTYSCINWLRTLPYVRAWATKYEPQGLVVIGVHTPEFAFEKNVDNVRRAARDMRIAYPVAIDSDYGIWNAFSNVYWPALYFADAQGRVRHHRFGEGDYDTSERVLQRLLAEAGARNVDRGLVSVDARGAEAAPDWASELSPETYVGYEKTTNFSSPGGVVLETPHGYIAPPSLALNSWALSGNWTMRKNAIVSNAANARIAFRFHARDLHLVMGSETSRSGVRYRVTIDGQPPRASHGADADADGNGTLAEPRLYQLVRQPKPIVDRRFEIEFLDPGAEAFSFTFG